MIGKRVFVSGGAGVIGQELVPRLVARGAGLLVGDLKARPSHFPPEVQYRVGDLNGMTDTEVRLFDPDIFIHLAATLERSEESCGFSHDNFLHNIRLSHHLMSLAKEAPSLRRVIFASSYLVYDPSLYQFDAPRDYPVSLAETDHVSPRNLVGMAKLAHELELRFLDHFCRARFSTVSARIYRGYGLNSRDVISRWIKSILAGQAIEVYRPEEFFDYIYARDTAEGLIRLAEKEGVTGVVNLGTGRSRRVGEVVNILRRHFPSMVATAVEQSTPLEASQADMTRYRRDVGWQPEYDLERAIPEIIEHERARLTAAPIAPPHLTVLVSSAGAKVPLVRAMQDAARRIDPHAKVVAGDSNPSALAAYVADDFWQMPLTCDDAMEAILVGLRERCISCVLPTRDAELAFWARHSARFQAMGVDVIVSHSATLELCLDKLAFSAFGVAHGLPFIPASAVLDDVAGEQFVVKERRGSGSRAIGINLDRETARSHAVKLDQPIFQPFVGGTEISIDAWLDRHCRVKGIVLRRRDHVVNGESRVTTTFRNERIETECTRILEQLQIRGPAVMQAIVDGAGELHVIECNPRFGGDRKSTRLNSSHT